MKCDKCGSQKITYYKQQRKDKIWVVTARCDNDHHPISGKPFYPISKFDISKLPVLGEEKEDLPIEPVSIKIKQKTIESSMIIMDFFEQLHKRKYYLFPSISTFKARRNNA